MSKKVIFLLIAVVFIIVISNNKFARYRENTEFSPSQSTDYSDYTTEDSNIDESSSESLYNGDTTISDSYDEETVSFTELVQPYKVIATLIDDAIMYEGRTLSSRKIGQVNNNDLVEILIDFNYQWYKIETNTGKIGWVQSENLSIPPDTSANPHRLTNEQLEGFIVYKRLESSTSYLIWVDLDRQLTYVFKDMDGIWKIYKIMLSATGINKAPTLTGQYTIKDRGEWFYNDRLQSGFSNWVRYEGVYLFHSLPKDRNREIVDYSLGERASAGCIRLSEEDIQWFYDSIPVGTTVLIK